MRRDAKCGALITIALILSTGSTHPQTGGTCVAASERATFQFGCFITARTILRDLPSGPLFWHLDRYPDNAAAEAAKGPNGTVVQSFGTVWLFTIAVAGWKPSTGERVAEIGPLPLVRAEQQPPSTWKACSNPGWRQRYIVTPASRPGTPFLARCVSRRRKEGSFSAPVILPSSSPRVSRWN